MNGTVATLWGCAALGIVANAWLVARPSSTTSDVTSTQPDNDCLATAAVGREHAPPNCERELVRLKFQVGLSYREIEEITGISQGNIGYFLHKAVKELKDRWQREGGPA